MAILSLMIAASVAAQAAPPSAATMDDLRCMAVVAAVIGTQKDQEDAGLTGGLMYFMGRIDGRQPGFDLETNLAALLNQADAGTVLKANAERCGNALTERGTFLSTLGEKMQSKGK